MDTVTILESSNNLLISNSNQFNLLVPDDLSSLATFSILYTLLEDAPAMHVLSSSSIKSGYSAHKKICGVTILVNKHIVEFHLKS